MRLGQGMGRGDGYSFKNGFSPRYESEAKRGDFDRLILIVPLSSHLCLLAKDPTLATRGRSDLRAGGSGSFSWIGPFLGGM